MPLREGVNIDRGGAVPSGVWALFCPEGLRWVDAVEKGLVIFGEQ
jgi:hypothetical protein